MPSARSLATFAAGAVTGAAVAGAITSPAGRFARMSGSSIAEPSAAGWITDFVNAAYYRREPGERAVADLRLAQTIVTTAWARHPERRLHGRDVVGFHRAFGRDRIGTAVTARGTLDRDQLLAGAARLLGDWFPDAVEDDARRGWGIAFETAEAREAHDPGKRLALARLGALTPCTLPPEQQVWHTYAPVAVASADAVVGALLKTETWPDHASAIGRFTPLRRSGLAGQTFEIEVAAGTAAGRPVVTRGYVTITRLVTPDDEADLRAYVDDLNGGLARFGRDEPPAVPGDAQPIVGFDLTTHEGHFIGAGNNRLVLYEREGQAYVRAAGTWDEMPRHLQRTYDLAGRQAQAEFWGETSDPDNSMLDQIAIAVSAAAPA